MLDNWIWCLPDGEKVNRSGSVDETIVSENDLDHRC